MTATDLERELARLADGIDVPVVPASADVARGRRRLLRTRLTVAGAAATTAAVLGASALLGQGTPRSTPDPVDRTPDRQRTVEAPDPVRALPDLDPRATNAEVLSRWNDVLAEHLDPQREHLEPYTLRTANEQSGGGYLGSRFGWVNAGEEGLGMLEVGVSRSRDAWDSPCTTGQHDLTCRDARGPGGEPARVGTSDSVTTVELEQPDGDVVTLTLDLLFGNNSLVPVSGTDVTPRQLLEAAADERLDLPQPPPVSSVDPAAFQQVLLDLVGGERELIGFPTGGQSLYEGGVFEGRRQVAVLDADAFPVSAGYGLPAGCDRRQFLRCERREVDGAEVFLAWVDDKYFPGVQVVHAGPENVVRVQWQRSGEGGADPDVGRLVELVTDARWQT
jgi:hypothetical protein